MNKSEFLDAVCAEVKCREAHKYIRNELSAHIEEAEEEYIKNGSDRETAMAKAVKGMGSPAEIGKSLDREHRMKPEISIMLLTLVFAVIGLAAMFASRGYGVFSFGKYVISAIIGILALVGTYFFDYTKIEKHSFKIYAVSLCILYIMAFGGAAYNGVRRFLNIGFLSISSESAFIMFTLSFPGMIKRFRGKGIIGMIMLSALALIFVIPILLMPDMKTTMVIYMAFLTVMTSCVLKGYFGENIGRNAFIFDGMNLICIAAAVISASERISYRIAASRDVRGCGWQQHMAQFWLDASKWFGKTDALYKGAGIEKTLPASATDFMFVNVSAVLGRAAALLIVAAAVVFIIRIFMSAFKIKNRYGFALSICACTMLAVQFVIGILVNLGLIPVVSAGIPFISYGGTGYVTNMILTGIILSVWRRNSVAAEMTESTKKRSFIYFENKKLIIDFGSH